MTAFEDFVSLELPKRRPLLKPADIGSYDGDPNLSTNPVILGAPLGTWYYEPTALIFWTKMGDGSWEAIGGPDEEPVLAAIILTVDGTAGSDTPTTSRPAKLYGGDYSAYPFQTIQAAIDSVPISHKFAVTITVTTAGNYAGFVQRGLTQYLMTILGLQGVVTPTSGSATGTATSGTTKSLTKSGAGWTVDDFRGKFCRIVSGTGAGQKLIIATNTADTVTFASRASPAPNATSVFSIDEPKTIITSAIEYDAGIYHTQNVGSYTIEDFHMQGVVYGLVQTYSPSLLKIARCTAKTVTNGFLALYSTRTNWSQIGCLGSTSHGIFLFAMSGTWGNINTDKGWLVVSATGAQADGIRIEKCPAGGVQGVYVVGCGNNGVVLIDSPAVDLWYVESNGNKYGLQVKRSSAAVYEISCSSNTQHGLVFDFGGRLDLSGPIAGTGNTLWGAHVGYGVGGLLTLTTVPTLTGTSGNATVDGTTALVWSTDFDVANEYAYNIAKDARIVRV